MNSMVAKNMHTSYLSSNLKAHIAKRKDRISRKYVILDLNFFSSSFIRIITYLVMP